MQLPQRQPDLETLSLRFAGHRLYLPAGNLRRIALRDDRGLLPFLYRLLERSPDPIVVFGGEVDFQGYSRLQKLGVSRRRYVKN